MWFFVSCTKRTVFITHIYVYTTDVDNADLTEEKAVFILCYSYFPVKVNI